MYDNVRYQYQVINGHTTSIPNTSRTGYDFIRWVANGNTWNTTSSIEDNMVITAEYEKYVFDISIDANGGSNSSNTTMEYGSQLSQPTTSRTNNVLDGWYYVASYENHSAGEKVTFPVTITGDLSIKAEWNVTVTYKVKSNTYTTRTIRSGTTASNISCSAAGYTFNYWYSTNSSQRFNFTTIVSQHLTLNANVTPISYNITYVLNNGTNDSRNRTTYTINDSFYIYNPTQNGYTFDGWTGTGLSSATLQPYVSGSTGDRTYTANWTFNGYNIYRYAGNQLSTITGKKYGSYLTMAEAYPSYSNPYEERNGSLTAISNFTSYPITRHMTIRYKADFPTEWTFSSNRWVAQNTWNSLYMQLDITTDSTSNAPTSLSNGIIIYTKVASSPSNAYSMANSLCSFGRVEIKLLHEIGSTMSTIDVYGQYITSAYTSNTSTIRSNVSSKTTGSQKTCYVWPYSDNTAWFDLNSGSNNTFGNPITSARGIVLWLSSTSNSISAIRAHFTCI